jgi:hypothetical protein
MAWQVASTLKTRPVGARAAWRFHSVGHNGRPVSRDAFLAPTEYLHAGPQHLAPLAEDDLDTTAAIAGRRGINSSTPLHNDGGWLLTRRRVFADAAAGDANPSA